MTSFSEEDLKKIKDFLKVRWRGKNCPMCQTGDWFIQPNCFELREFNQGDLPFIKGSPILPLIPITCSNCANTILINAIQIGVIKSEQAAKNE